MTQTGVTGKFVEAEGRRFLIKGVAYGTFAPDLTGAQFPTADRVREDFAAMAQAGINTVRTYTPPSTDVLDAAAEQGLRLMIGLPWSQHVAFLDDRALTRQIRQDTVAHVRRLGAHPSALLFAVGNEIPPAVVRWHGQARVERFLRELYDEVKSVSPDSLLTYVNYPPTEYLDTECYDVCSFNVYLHREPDLRAYLARLQHIAAGRPLLLAEAGADSIREGAEGQAAITAMHLTAAFEEGCCGAVAFSWTDEWWRGGHAVQDWAFGLVDAERRPKPALAAVARVFAEAPFAAEKQRQWPRVSVVVCAYNAADTITDCLDSLGLLSYPDFEVIVVNDGSRDQTGEIAKQYPNVRVIEVPNGGLSAARNIGLREATGEVVAYTDADVRVDPDWLTYLVQPFVTSDVVGSGGPNVVPADDPWVAQCVARSPGGPTHVLLNDRIAEHVPGCNMAFRRDALLAIGGFNPVYLRAGDDVDVCWRLQAKKLQIGFAPSALVWHHHRPSIRAYWRQQVGYGEGEAWLDAHHPEKFVGGHMVWRGRIYSPLPFVRSLSGRRINTGIWGTAAFPSVYRTDVSGAQFLPHSAEWLVASTVLLLAGLMGLLTPYRGAVALLLSAGAAGWLTTVLRCVLFGWNSDVEGLPADTLGGHLRHRLLIAWLHFMQPLARFSGRLRGMWSPPLVIEPERVTRLPWKAPVPSRRDAVSAMLLLGGGRIEEYFWSEAWTSHDAVLTETAGLLRASRPARYIDVDDGWHPDRDLSVVIGRWGWLDLRALVEEHGGAKCLLRVGTRLRPALGGVVLALTLAVLAISVTSAAIVLKWPWLSVSVVGAIAIIFARAAWETTTALAVVRRAVARTTNAAGMIPMRARPGGRTTRRFDPIPATLAQTIQAAVAITLGIAAFSTASSLTQEWHARGARNARELVAIAANTGKSLFDAGGAVAVAPNGDLLLADIGLGVIRRLDTRMLDEPVRANDRPAPGRRPGPDSGSEAVVAPITTSTDLAFASPADVEVAGNGDVYVADAENNRICRIERLTGKIVTIAGTGAAGFDGDLRQATQVALHAPNAVAVATNGDIYIADTLNNRVRVVAYQTGLIRTVAGDGQPGRGDALGDGGPATAAHLHHPTDVAIAPNGDLYIADMGHNRVRIVDPKTGIIRTFAGDGHDRSRGDGGSAARASLAGPAGLALVASGRRVTVYVAEYLSDSVRVISPSGVISTLASPTPFTAPVRLAYRPGGWLYIAGEGGAVTAVNVSKSRRPYQLATAVALRLRKVT